MNKKLKVVSLVIASAMVLGFSHLSFAFDYPTRSIELVVDLGIQFNHDAFDFCMQGKG
jgi:hypothetical protein